MSCVSYHAQPRAIWILLDVFRAFRASDLESNENFKHVLLKMPHSLVSEHRKNKAGAESGASFLMASFFIVPECRLLEVKSHQ